GLVASILGRKLDRSVKIESIDWEKYTSGEETKRERIALLERLLELGLDLNFKGPEAPITVWGFIIHCLIMDPQYLIWKLVRVCLESGASTPSWRLHVDRETAPSLELTIGRDTHMIPKGER